MIKKIAMIMLLSVFFPQCALFFRTSVPIKTIYHQVQRTAGVETLLVFLPGRHSTPEDFFKYGFVSALKSLSSPVDSVAVDAHLGYYIHRNLLERLKLDVILPAKKKGYKNIWIVGISMGGIGTLLYNEKHHDTITGVMVLAPFLGDKEVIEEIENAGGLMKWKPAEISKEDYQRKLWLWLKKYANKTNTLPKIIIGYGKEDRFAGANKLLADILPTEQVHTVAGEHDWGPWKKLFQYFISKNVFSK